MLATYFGATELGYSAFLIEGGRMSPRAAHTRAIEDILHTTDLTTASTILAAASR